MASGYYRGSATSVDLSIIWSHDLHRMMALQAATSSLLLLCCSAFLWVIPGADAGYQSIYPTTIYETSRETMRYPETQETVPSYPPPEWIGMITTTPTDGADVEAENNFAAYPVPGQRQVLPNRPGASLVSLAMVLHQSDPLTRAALLRQFVHSVVKLKSPYVDLRSSATSRSSQDSSTQVQLKVVEGKLDGILRAAESSFMTKKVISAGLLVPFIIVVREAEDLFYSIARKGDTVGMCIALNTLGPMLVRGLSYLEGGPFEASEHIDAVRTALLERVKELDAALLEGQGDLEEVLRRYPVDMSEEALQHDRSVAAAKSMNNGVLYTPPPIMHPYPTSSSPSIMRRLGKFLVAVLVVLVISRVASAVSRPSPSPPPTWDSRADISLREQARRSREQFNEWVAEQRQESSERFERGFLTPNIFSPHRRVQFEPSIQHILRGETVAMPSAPPRTPYDDLPPSYDEVMMQGGRRD